MRKKSEVLRRLQKTKTNRGLFQFLLWQLGYYKDSLFFPVPNDFCYPNTKEIIDSKAPIITWVNHSTFLIKYGEIHFLTDPIWNIRCSPIKHFGPQRHIFPPIGIDELPKIDIVLISHNHYDHLDHYSVGLLQQLFPDILWVIPEGVRKWFNKHFKEIPNDKIIELTWGESFAFSIKNCHLKIFSVPAQHFSGRGLFDQNKTLWMGLVVLFEIQNQKVKKFYYAGDTGYHPEYFKEIGSQFGPIDLSLIPIGVYSPREFMQPIHVNPEESVKIHQEVESKLSIGCHFGTFKLSSEDLRQPPYDLFHILQREQVDVQKFRVLEPGQSINW